MIMQIIVVSFGQKREAGNPTVNRSQPDLFKVGILTQFDSSRQFHFAGRAGGWLSSILAIFSRIASRINSFLRYRAFSLSHLIKSGGNLMEVDTIATPSFGGRPPGGFLRPPRLLFLVIILLAGALRESD
jgi:hypothetical protein